MTYPIYSKSVADATNFLEYAEKHELALLQIHIGSKRPVGEAWQNLFSTDPVEWAQWKSLSFNLGVHARVSRLVIVDPDVADGKRGAEHWAAWCEANGLSADDYPAHVASARGGQHIYFRIPDGVTVKGANEPIQDVDIIVNGQTVAPGSYFDGTSEGKQSGWYTMLSDAPPHTMPAALIALCTRKPRKVDGALPAGTHDASDTAELLTWMAEREMFADYADWIAAGMALKTSFGPEGLSLWEITCDASVSPDQAASKWESFSGSEVTLLSLLKRAKDAGWTGTVRKSNLAMFGGVAASLPPLPPAFAPPLVPVQNAATLLTRSFAPVRYVIPGYIAEGCSILAGKPKIGKSWFVLDAALAVAGGNGGRAFGVQAEQGNVLYLALEDNERRLKSRIRKVLGPFAAGPDKFEYRTEWKRADEGGLSDIEAWIKSVPKATLIIVDVLARFRPMATGRNTAAYDADYAAIAGLQGLASKYSVAIVIVHHLRKNAADNDPFDKVSGTLGLSGAADTILIIDRDGQGIVLYGRGRDIEEIETAIVFDKPTCRWRVMGSASEARMSGARKAILEALKGSSAAMSPADVVAETGAKPGNVRFLLRKMVDDGTIMKAERGKYLIDLSAPAHNATKLTNPSVLTPPLPLPSLLIPPLPLSSLPGAASPLPTFATNGAASLSTHLLPPLPG
jgi:AAA domain/Bifunctional DNA primase/polymerase, N-terminal/Primase C terminal 2 (PriCT-2)